MASIIRVQNLRRCFDDLVAVDGLSFEVRRHEIFGLLGPNGAGKTTTIRMICGLLPPSAGAIEFMNGKALKSQRSFKSLIGYCPQENIFYPKLSCFEQLVFIGQMYGAGTRELRVRATQLLEMLGLREKVHTRASDLSGGMQRRLNICLALIHDPEVLILDEPEAGLDPQSRIMVREFIRGFGKEKTVILTTHNMDEADRMADRVAIIDYGKLLLLDTPEKLKKTVGEGDILEIIPEGGGKEAVKSFVKKVADLSMDVRSGDNAILIKHPDLINKMAIIRELADSSGVVISEFKLRENTLEDVFIHLTGRKLRQ
jgi:ABC-2 type transport system ATP-binding protein